MTILASARVSIVWTIMCFLLLMPAGVSAQSVSFSGAQSHVLASGLTGPAGVALNAAGDLFVEDNNTVLMIPANGGAQTVLASGLSGAAGVAVDNAGNVYVAESGSNRNRVLKIPAGCQSSACFTTVGTGLNGPLGVVVNSAGTVFIADTNNNRVVGVPAVGNQFTVDTYPWGLNHPDGVAVGPNGNLFIANHNAVVEVPASTIHGCSDISGDSCARLHSGFVFALGVAVDSAGNVFVADFNTDQVVKIPAGSGARTTVGSGLNDPFGVAVNRSGDVYIADSGNDRVELVNTVAANFGAVGLDPNTNVRRLFLNYTVNANVVLANAPTIVTQGVPNLDFFPDGLSTCTGAQTAGSSCFVELRFQPLATGLRIGAVQLADSSGNVLATTFLRGVGAGPGLAFSGGAQATVPTGLVVSPAAVTVTAAGTLLSTDISNGSLSRTPSGGFGTRIFNGLNQPYGVAVDGAGNTFIADTFNNQVRKLAPGCLSTVCQTTVGTGLDHPYGVAVDGMGDIYIADTNNNRIVKVPARGGPQSIVNTGTYSLSFPQDVAVDAAGNVIVADTNNYHVVEISPVGSVRVINAGLYPTAVDVDAAGNVFIADALDNLVAQIPAGCATSACQNMVGSGLSGPNGVAVDGAGDVFIADTANRRVVEVPRAQVPVVAFPETAVGGTSSPQRFTVQNIGNAPLFWGGANAVTNFSLDLGSSTCFHSNKLDPGASCDFGFVCTPSMAGALNGTLTITGMTGSGITLGVPLSCTGFAGGSTAPSVSFTGAPPTAPYQSTFTVTATTNASTMPAITGSGACSVSGITGTPANTSATVTMTSGTGACSLTAIWPADHTYASATRSATTTATGMTLAGKVSYAGARSELGPSFTFPVSVAVDRAGNVFISDSVMDVVVKVPADGSPAFQVGTGLDVPMGLAVDGAGNLFIADGGHSRIVKIPAGGGAQTIVPTTGLAQPNAVAVDTAGNLYIADPINSRVVKVPAGGGAQTAVGTGLLEPFGVAVDLAGNVYISDGNTNARRVVKVPAGGGAQIIIASGLASPRGLAVDAAGNVYVADNPTGQVIQIPPGCVTSACRIVVASIPNPLGVAVDEAGDLFIAAWQSHVVKVLRTSPNFANVPVGASAQLTLSFSILADVTLDQSVNVATQGAPNLDFTVSGTPDCTGAKTAGTLCAVTVRFSPLAAGLRMGAVQLKDSLGNVLVTAAVSGQGIGPAIAFPAGPQTTVAVPGLVGPNGVAVDAAGNLFITKSGNEVMKVPAGGGNPSTVPSTGLLQPFGLAVDGAGNVVIADVDGNQVVKTPIAAVAQTTVAASGLVQPRGTAVNARGDVFIADSGNNRVVKVPAGCTSSACQTMVGTGLNVPIDVAVDGAGNIFIADTGNNRIVKVPADGGAQTIVSTGLNGPLGVAVDAVGNVFIADTINSRVLEVPIGGGPQTTMPVGGLNRPYDVALNAAGDLFVADHSNNRVVQLQRSQARTLTFGATTIGGTSAPQSVTVQNIGNAPLAFAGFAASSHFGVNAGSTTCSTSSPLPVGASCNVGVVCSPTLTGALSGTLILTDNALNGVGATQTVPLSCTGAHLQPTVSFIGAPATANYLSTFAVAATTNASSNAVITAGGACSVQGTTVTMTSGTGTCSLTATWAADDTYAAATATQTTVAAVIAPTVSFTGAPASAVYQSTFTVTATTSASTTPALQANGACSITGNRVTMTSGQGNCGLSATWAADSNYTTAQTFQFTTAIKGTPTVSFTGAPATMPYGGTFFLFASSSSGLPMMFTGSGACSVPDPFVGVARMTSGIGTCSLDATWPGDSNWVAASASQTTAAAKATPLARFLGAPATAPYHATFSVSATTNASTAAAITISGACSITGNTVTMTSGTGTCSLSAVWAADDNYLAATVTQSTVASTLAPTVTFTGAPATAVYGATFSVAATTNASTVATITASGSCSIAGTTVTMTSGTGSCSLSATWAADTNYAAAIASQSVAASKRTPTFSFTGAPASALYRTTFTVAATTNASTAAVITASGACSIASNTVTMTSGTGTCSLGAAWAADNNYTAAAATQSTTAAKTASTTTINSKTPNPSSPGQGVTVAFTVQGSGTPTGSVTVIASTGESCTGTLAAGTGSCSLTFSTAGSRTVSAAYLGDGNFIGSTSATVAQSVVSPTVTLSPITPIRINQKVGTTSVAETVTLKNSGSTTLIISAMTISADFAIAAGTTCSDGGMLAAGASCQIKVTFKPTAKVIVNGNLTIIDNGVASPRTVTLTGHGI